MSWQLFYHVKESPYLILTDGSHFHVGQCNDKGVSWTVNENAEKAHMELCANTYLLVATFPNVVNAWNGAKALGNIYAASCASSRPEETQPLIDKQLEQLDLWIEDEEDRIYATVASKKLTVHAVREFRAEVAASRG
jgi:hypothetical protein